MRDFLDRNIEDKNFPQRRESQKRKKESFGNIV